MVGAINHFREGGEHLGIRSGEAHKLAGREQTSLGGVGIAAAAEDHEVDSVLGSDK